VNLGAKIFHDATQGRHFALHVHRPPLLVLGLVARLHRGDLDLALAPQPADLARVENDGLVSEGSLDGIEG
jgi:hypothetical protein